MGSIVAIATALPASAQIRPMTPIPFMAEKLLPGQKSSTPKIDVEKEYPLLKGKFCDQTISPFSEQPVTVMRVNRKATPLMINQNLTILGNILSKDFMGICSFNPTSTIVFITIEQPKLIRNIRV